MGIPPVACSLGPDRLADRSLVWRNLIREAGVARESIQRGFRLTLRDAAGVAEALEELIGLEAQCCPWMRMELVRDQGVVLVVTADSPVGVETLARWLADVATDWVQPEPGELLGSSLSLGSIVCSGSTGMVSGSSSASNHT